MTMRSRVRAFRYRGKDDQGNDRLRHSTYFLTWVQAQANRLTVDTSVIIARLRAGETFEDIEGTATPPAESAPVNTAAPVVTGTARVGQVLTTTNGTWTGNPAPTFTRKWQRGNVDIAGATNTTYTLVAADAGAVIRSVVTATNSEGSASANSAGTAAVQQIPANTVLPAITGTAQVGQVLTVSNGTWTGTPAPTFARQWKADGANIAGATATTYTPVVGDVGKVITCTVTATNAAGTLPATTAATAAVIAA